MPCALWNSRHYARFNPTELAPNFSEQMHWKCSKIYRRIIDKHVEMTKPMIQAMRMAGTKWNECLKRKADEEQKTAVKLVEIYWKSNLLIC